MSRFKKIALILIPVVISFGIFKLMNSPDFLFELAESQKRDSAIYESSLRRVYSLSEEKQVHQVIVDRIQKGQRTHLYELYFRYLGAAGKSDDAELLMEKYIEYGKSDKYRYLQFEIVNALGAIGSERSLDFLRNVLSDVDSDVPKFIIARAIYLATGKVEEFTDHYSNSQTYRPTSEAREIYQLIAEGIGRTRSYEDMVAVDELFVPDVY